MKVRVPQDADPAYYFEADPAPDQDHEFHLIWMWKRMGIKITKMMWMHADPDPQNCKSRYGGHELKSVYILVLKYARIFFLL
jgi:hypothetical protein